MSTKSMRPAEISHVFQVAETGDRGLALVAGAQRAMVRRSQLLALGITRGAYEHRLATGSLHHVLPSVVSVVHPVLELWAAETAALLWVGDDAVLSHESAAALWGLTAHPPFVALTVIGRRVRSQPGVRVHQVKALDIRDVTLHHGSPVTSPARTIIDCAARGPVDRLLSEARVRRLVTDDALHAAMQRCPGRTGTQAVRGFLSDEYEQGYSRSEAERVLRRLVKAAEMNPPRFNTRVVGFEVDAVWEAQKLVVEVDGYGAHGHRGAFERDRKKDQALVEAGYAVVRFTWTQLTRRPFLVVATLAATLAMRSKSAI